MGVLTGTPSTGERRNLGNVTSRKDVRGEVREFLITRRAKISPEQAGLPRYGARRRVTAAASSRSTTRWPAT